MAIGFGQNLPDASIANGELRAKVLKYMVCFTSKYVLRIVMLFLFSATSAGGGSTGVVREPRHRPLLLVPYRTASTRESSPPSQLTGALTHAVLDDRDPQWK